MENLNSRIDDHQKAQTAVNALNEQFNLSLQKGEGLEGIKNATKKFCFSCMQPVNPDCEICNNHPRKDGLPENPVLFALQSQNAKLD